MEELRQAAADDLRLLAQLHGGELSAAALADLQRGPFEELLGLSLASTLAAEALQVVDKGLAPDTLAAAAADAAAEAAKRTERADEAAPPSSDPLDLLAADFADIYLTHQLQLSPCESPWLDDDGLMNGKPMFEVREWYERFGLAAEDWRLRGDDHLSLQLSFIAHLLEREGDGMVEAGRFMDQHLLRWLPDFAQGVASRCATPFYAGLAMLTYAHAEELRSLIEQVTGEPRLVPEAEETGGNDDVAPFAGGSGPGW